MNAPAASPNDKPAPKKPKPRPVHKKTRDAIEAMLSGAAKTQKDAADLVGMSESGLCRALQKPQVKEFVAGEIKKRLSTVGAIKSAATLERLAEQATSEYVQADASKHILGIAGVSPAGDRAIGGGGGVVFNLVFQHQQPPIRTNPTQPIDVTPDTQEDQ